MKIRFKNTPEQVELIKAIGSKNRVESIQAQDALAVFLRGVVQEVLQQASTVAGIYADEPFNEDDSPSFPLDPYFDHQELGYVTVWSQTMAGGLPASQDVSTIQELKFQTYKLDSAISMDRKYARKARLEVISRYIQRMIQEILVKQERNGWAVILKALAEASTTTTKNLGRGLGYTDGNSTTYGSSALKHVVRSASTSVLTVDDFNSLLIRAKRINASWAGGTASQPYSRGVTDLYVSPEVKGDIRKFAYNPISTDAAPVGGTDAIGLDDMTRREIFNSAGMDAIFGINVVDMNEFGVGQKYNKIFDHFAGATTYTNITGGLATAFTEASDEILVGVDNTRDAFVRPIMTDGSSSVNVLTDDQYVARQEKFGYYTSLEEGRVCVDSRAVLGILLG